MKVVQQGPALSSDEIVDLICMLNAYKFIEPDYHIRFDACNKYIDKLGSIMRWQEDNLNVIKESVCSE